MKRKLYLAITAVSIITIFSAIFMNIYIKNNKIKINVEEGDLAVLEDDNYVLTSFNAQDYSISSISKDGIKTDVKYSKDLDTFSSTNFSSQFTDFEMLLPRAQNKKVLKEFYKTLNKKHNMVNYYTFKDELLPYAIFTLIENSIPYIDIVYIENNQVNSKKIKLDKLMLDDTLDYNLTTFNIDYSHKSGKNIGLLIFSSFHIDGVKEQLLKYNLVNLDMETGEYSVEECDGIIDSTISMITDNAVYMKSEKDSNSIYKHDRNDFSNKELIFDIEQNYDSPYDKNHINVYEDRFENLDFKTENEKLNGLLDIKFIDREEEKAFEFNNIKVFDEAEIKGDIYVNQAFTKGNNLFISYNLDKNILMDTKAYTKVIDMNTNKVLLKFSSNTGNTILAMDLE